MEVEPLLDFLALHFMAFLAGDGPETWAWHSVETFGPGCWLKGFWKDGMLFLIRHNFRHASRN